MLPQKMVARLPKKIFLDAVMDDHAPFRAAGPETRQIVRSRLRNAEHAGGAIVEAAAMEAIERVAAGRFVLGKKFFDQVVLRYNDRTTRAAGNEIVHDVEERNSLREEKAQIGQLVHPDRAPMPPVRETPILPARAGPENIL